MKISDECFDTVLTQCSLLPDSGKSMVKESINIVKDSFIWP